MIDPELRQYIKHLQLWARHSISGEQHGSYLSAFAGSGLEFDDFRPYVSGDDLKHMDWKVSARSQNPYVRVFREEREQNLLLLVDTSSSMFFGSTKGREKIRATLDFAALFVALATCHHDKVSLALFSDHITHFHPPSRGSAHSFRLLKSILTAKCSEQATSLQEALRFTKSLRKPSLVILLSDFLDDQSYYKELKVVATKHDLICLRVYDPVERDPPQKGFLTYLDIESGKSFRGKLRGLISQKSLSDKVFASHEQWLRMVRGCGADSYEVNAVSDDPLKVLYSITRSHKRKFQAR